MPNIEEDIKLKSNLNTEENEFYYLFILWTEQKQCKLYLVFMYISKKQKNAAHKNKARKV